MRHPLSLVVGLTMILALEAPAEPLEPIRLWPDKPPGESAQLPPEADTTKPTDNLIAGKRLIRLGNVSSPTITVYPAPKEKANGSAVVVCPGGGYHILAMDLEGTEVCEWLNSIGVTGILLKYRVPARQGRERYAAPFEDAQRAMGIVRQRAAEWNLDPNRIGILGFSAGAHLAATTSCQFSNRVYSPVDEADHFSSRPNFTVLIYPGYLAKDQEKLELPPELTVSSNTPPMFLIQTQDDSVPVESSLAFYRALKKARVPAEMHLYANGGHGYGLRPTQDQVTRWPQLAEIWLKNLK